MEKFNQNHETSQHFETAPSLPKIETVQLTTFEELHDYRLHGGGYIFKPYFRSKTHAPVAKLEQFSYVG